MKSQLVKWFGSQPVPDEDALRLAGSVASAGQVTSAPAGVVVQSAGSDARAAIDMIETDVLSAMSRLRQDVDGAKSLSLETESELVAIHDAMEQLKDASGDASRDISALAVAANQMASSAEQIGRSMGAARSQIDEAAFKAESVGELLRDLTSATAEIHGIAEAIAEVARRTNLLALNATIEAARAGEAGRGFAVVANEVKQLSQQTNSSVDDIRRRVARLEKTATDSAQAVTEIVACVREAHPLLKIVGDASEEQAQSTEELSRSTTEAARFVETVGRQIHTVDQGAMAARASSVKTREAIDACAQAADGLSRRFVPVVRQTRLGDRRQHDRFPADLPVTVTVGGKTYSARSVDISRGGVLVAPITALSKAHGSATGLAGLLDFGNGCALDARLVAASSLGLHFAFAQGSGPANAQFADLHSRVVAEYAPMIELAQGFASAIEAAMRSGLSDRMMREADLFDSVYMPISGTNPQQFTTRSLAALERLLTPIQESYLTRDKRLVFALSIDRNGYIPVHNVVYSQTPRANDVVWNTANCRNKRIFDDRAGITAARSTRPFIVQAYQRDMGGGQFVMMREVDAPITINGSHWGGVRMAYKF